MKRYLIWGASFAAVLFLLLFLRPHRASNSTPPENLEPPVQTLAVAKTGSHLHAVSPERRGVAPDVDSSSRIEAAQRESAAQLTEVVRQSNEAGNPSVSFYGLVVDQDTNPLPNVTVDVTVVKEYVDPFPEVKTTRTRLQKQTGADGRFEVSGLEGKYVAIEALAKDGYEPEVQGHYGFYGGASHEL